VPYQYRQHDPVVLCRPGAQVAGRPGHQDGRKPGLRDDSADDAAHQAAAAPRGSACRSRDQPAAASGDDETAPDQAWRQSHLPLIDKIRVTLDWALAAPERAPLGIALFGAAARLFYMHSFVPEGWRYCDQFVALIGPEWPARGPQG
jgi:hypothetical protein